MRQLSCAIVTLMLAATMGAPAVTAEQAKAKAAPAKPAVTSASPVNINTASSSQIEVLPGIGARPAERIVEYRQKNGGFKKIEEMLEVL
jgi:competence protein ComEA